MNDFKETDYSRVCPIFIKKYFDYKDVKDTYENFIPNLPYNTRGLYFVPLRTDYSKILYLFSRDQSLVSDKKNEFNKGKKNHKFTFCEKIGNLKTKKV